METPPLGVAISITQGNFIDSSGHVHYCVCTQGHPDCGGKQRPLNAAIVRRSLLIQSKDLMKKIIAVLFIVIALLVITGISIWVDLDKTAPIPTVQEEPVVSEETVEVPAVTSASAIHEEEPEPAPILRAYDRAITNLINAQRATPLSPRVDLMEAAQKRAVDLCATGQFSHDGYKEYFVGLPGGLIGENLARRFATPEETVDAFMNSPLHALNIKQPRFKSVGIG